MFQTKNPLAAMPPARFREIGSLILIATSIAAVACSTNAPPYRAPIPGDSVEIAVRHWRTDIVATDYSGSSDFGQILAEYIAGSLQALGYRAIAIPRNASLPAGTAYVFDGAFENLDSGSWNLRFWIGFGAGHALVNASGTLSEVASGKIIVQRTLRARSNTWQFQENILRRTCSRIARAFAKNAQAALRHERSRSSRP